MSTAWVVLSIVNATGWLLPAPADKLGWGLRVHNLSARGPYLRGEGVYGMRFDVTLINFSKETREHDPLPAARATADLRLVIIQPDGKPLYDVGLLYSERNPFTQPRRLRGGEFSSFDFNLKEFGYGFTALTQAGRHRVEASMKIGGKVVKAPPVEFEVVAVPPAAVLVSHAVPLEGLEANRPVNERSRPAVLQVSVGDRTLLIYCVHYDPSEPGGGPYVTKRLAELPGKVEMMVEGAYGARNPLTITYRTSPDAEPTKLVINSIGGSTRR